MTMLAVFVPLMLIQQEFGYIKPQLALLSSFSFYRECSRSHTAIRHPLDVQKVMIQSVAAS